MIDFLEEPEVMTLFLAELEVITDFLKKPEVMTLFYKGSGSHD
jgi:hypothetical protein